MNFFKGFSCTKVNIGLLSANKKKEGYVKARKRKNERKFEDGMGSAIGVGTTETFYNLPWI